MKKTLHVLFVLTFLLSLSSLSAYAQAGKTTVAYLPLLPPGSARQTISPRDPGQIISQGGLVQTISQNPPIQFRARQVFDTLAPKLIQAQADGRIVRFEPEFSAGLLKVEYVAGLDLSALLGSGLPVFDDPQAVLAYTRVGQEMMNSQIAAPSGTPYINLDVNESCFYAGNLGAGNIYKAYLQDSSGRPVATVNGSLDSDGWTDDCFNGIYSDMVPGYAFRLFLYDSSETTLLNTYTTQIASLYINSIKVAKKNVQGGAPIGSILDVWLHHQNLDVNGLWVDTHMNTTTSKKGVWQVVFGSAAMRGGDEVEVDWSQPSSIFTFERYLPAPSVECYLGGTYCYIFGNPGAKASISFKHGKTSYTSSGRFSMWGSFGASLINSRGEPIFLAAGDQVKGTGVSSLKLPSLTAAPDYPSDTITGMAPANRYFEARIEVYDPDYGWWDWYSEWTGTNAAGVYAADFSCDFDIQPADTFLAGVYYTDPATGNVTWYWNLIAP